MDKKVLGDQIEKAVGDLFEKIQQLRQEQYSQLIRILKQGRSDYDPSAPLASLHAFTNELDEALDVLNAFPDQYLMIAKQVTEELDEQISITQSEDRFISKEQDSPVLKALKAAKRGVRSTQKMETSVSNQLRKWVNKSPKKHSPWTQQVPVMALVRYHFADNEQQVTQWLDEDARHWVSAIDAIISGASAEGREQENEKAISDIIQKELEKVEEAKSAVKQKMKDAKNELFEEMLNWAQKAGTAERQSSFYSEIKVDRKRTSSEKKITKRLEKWQLTLSLLLNRAATIVEFLQFEHTLKERSASFNEDLDDYFQSTFYSFLQKAEEQLSEQQSKASTFDKTETEALGNFLQESKATLDEVFKEALSAIESAREDEHLPKESERFAEEIFLKANDLTEKAEFLHEVDLESTPPKISNRQIDWRLLVVRALKEQLLKSIEPAEQKYDEFLAHREAEVKEILEVVDVNFESAIELCTGDVEKGESPADIVQQGIERTLAKIEACKESIEQKQQGIKLVITEKGQELTAKMLKLINEGDSKELQIIDAKYRVKEKAQGWRTKLGARWARLQDKLMLFGRFFWKKIRLYINTTRQFLGFEEAQAEEVKKADISSYLTETDEKINELPYIYRKLFKFDVDADRRFYVSMHENFNYLKKSYERWQEGFPATFATMGEKGSGKSTYLNLITQEFFQDKEVANIKLQKSCWTGKQLLALLKEELGLEKADSKDEVIKEIRSSKKGGVIIIECLQNLYLRNINGYEAIEDFLYIISETKDRVFWVTSCSRYGWNYLDVTHSLSEYFSHIIRCDMLDEDQIKAVIMNRHRSSGYELVFEPDESHAKSRAYRKLLDREEEAQQYLREKYFEDLAALAEGNASIAMIFWIRSIREFDETHCFIKPLEVTMLQMVQELKPDVLFTLAAIVLHDTLTSQELSFVLQFNKQQSRLILNKLKTRGLLQEVNGLHHINQLMYRQVVRVLKERNIIHLV